MAAKSDMFAIDAPQRFGPAVERIHEQAIALTGLDDFGPDDYRVGLEIILRSVDSDIRFAPGGGALAWGNILLALASRLYAVEGWKSHPEALQAPVTAPIVITGIPRTGSTALHKLLAVDPQFQGLENWLALAPMPRPPREHWDRYPSFHRACEFLTRLFSSVPEFRIAHNIIADEVDECLEVLRQSFVSNRWACTWKAPSYDAWWQTRSERVSYHWLRDVLRLIGFGTERTWLLKNPGHIANLDLLFEAFPDARVVHTHRTPINAIPSIASTLQFSHRMYEGPAGDEWSTLLGPRELEKWADALRKAMPLREQHRERIFDVDHQRFVAAPMLIVAELYDRFGLHMTAETEAAMRARIVIDPERKYGDHNYNMAAFGIDPGEISERFGDYMDMFGFPRRSSMT